ncbi:MAG: LytR family transcriptional regulator, partial [Cyanobacteria bacterium J083]
MKPLFPNLKKHLGKRIVKSMMWSGIIAVTATISAGIGASLVIMKPFSVQIANFKDKLNEKKSVVSKAQSSSNELTRSVNILILGLDNSPFRLNKTGEISSVPHNDAVFVMRFEAADNSVKILNLPTQITANNLVKFDEKDYSRPALTTRIVSKSLNNLPIERYLRFNTQAVAELIDLLGGVEIFVAAKMTYTDHAQNLQIDIPPGWQNLDGNSAQQFIRFLDEKGETARRERQQILLQALHRRLTSPSISSRLGEIVP